VRYSPGNGGEWWDNNSGQNYKIGFRRAPASHSLNFNSMGFGAIGSGSFGQAIAQQRTFSAPGTLRSTPITGEPRRAADAESLLRSKAMMYAPPMARSSSSPFPPSSPSFDPPASAPATMDKDKGSPTSPVQGLVARKLSLSNYVAPGTASMVTPPMTPPESGRMRSASLPADAGMHADVPEPSQGEEKEEHEGEAQEQTPLPKPSFAIIGGQPATTVSPAPSPPSTSAPSKSPSSLAPLDLRIGSSELGAEMGVGGNGSLLSPPSSPAGSMSPLALSLSGLGAGASNSSSGSSTPTHNTNTARATGFPGPSPTSPLDSPYAALIRQWCFTGSPSGTPSATTMPAPTPGPVGAAGFGRGYGAGFPGFAIGGMADAGMVGGELLVVGCVS